MLAAVQLADAQVKSPAAAAKSLDKAVAASNDAKKATKVATWTGLASAYIDAYNAPAGNAWVGASKQELTLLMGSDKPVSEEQVTLAGTTYVKESYADKDFYYNPSTGQLAMIVVTKPIAENALGNALNAYKKAYEVDVKGAKLKDITTGLSLINQKYVSDAYNAYQLGDLVKASEYFALAAEAMNTAPLSQLDANSVYNAAFTAWMNKDYERAKTYFEKCLSYEYYYEDGEVFAKLADVYSNLNQPETSVAMLEQGFAKFPQSQAILIGLINYYISNNQDPARLFELIDLAKKNEPNNASLYYVEGNIYKQLGEIEKAAEVYYRCTDVNPEYEYGYIGAGVMFYEEAVKVSEAASTEYDDAKYNALVEKFEKLLLDAIDPFEKAYNVTKDENLKVSIAEYLKNIYYRFITKGEEYEAGYKKYDAVVKGAK